MCEYYRQNYSDGFFDLSKNGFLPIKEPLSKLPERYNRLQDIIDNLYVTKNNNNGILSIPNKIEEEIKNLPNYIELVKGENDIFYFQALFRTYTIITSAYTLELSYQEYIKSGNYGKARDLLPANLAEPLVYVSEKIGAYPWLDYFYAYGPGNYIKINPDGNLHWSNLDMACKFHGSNDEVGFMMVHVYINELSHQLVESVMEFGKNKCNQSLIRCYKILKEMNDRRKEMWTASRYERYNDFRVFIMGIQGNKDLFPNGLVYENCFNNVPQYYRGQTGAQDSIIPMIDIFTGIVDYYPDNQLTKYLLDLRSYRPKCIQDFFKDLREHYNNSNHNLFHYLKSTNNIEGLVYLLKIIDEVYLFRNGHWQFVQKYIMSNTKYSYATGGTPITSWLINQIEAVLNYENDIINIINDIVERNINGKKEDILESDLWVSLVHTYPRKRKLLEEQINELNNHDYNIHKIYEKNKELNLEDSK
jgi:indoleamine 2,3-dioxygenase